MSNMSNSKMVAFEQTEFKSISKFNTKNIISSISFELLKNSNKFIYKENSEPYLESFVNSNGERVIIIGDT